MLLIPSRDRVQYLIIAISEGFITERNRNLLEGVVRGLNIVEVCQSCREKTKTRDDEVEVAANASKGVR